MAAAAPGGLRVALLRGARDDVRAALRAVVGLLAEDHAARCAVGARGGEGSPPADPAGTPPHLPRHLSPRSREASFASQDTAGSGGSTRWALPPLPPMTLRTLVPEQASGAVLGRGGATSRALTRATGAAVKLGGRDGLDQPWLSGGERVISVAGAPAEVAAGALAVFDILAAETRKCVRGRGGGGGTRRALCPVGRLRVAAAAHLPRTPLHTPRLTPLARRPAAHPPSSPPTAASSTASRASATGDCTTA